MYLCIWVGAVASSLAKTEIMLYLSLGSNLGAPKENLQQAGALIAQRVGTIVNSSTIKQTQPWGFSSKNLFYNLAMEVDTTLSPLEALAVTQEIERELGRVQKSVAGNYADRLIDIDLLFFSNETFASEALTLPHQHMLNRRFVLEPLAEIAGEVLVPATNKTVTQHLQTLNERCTIAQLLAASAEHLEALQRLLPQLTERPTEFSSSDLEQLCASPLTAVYLLSDEENRIQATCTLCYAPSPTGVKAWLEDVVVDSDARGRGYAKRIVQHAISQAQQQGAKSLNLTSRPTRLAANALYQRLGFELRETNVYCMAF